MWWMLATAMAAPLGEPVDSVIVDGVFRGGFHFSITFGIGGGPDSVGLSHTMEIGGTLPNGITIAMLHTFVQNKGIWGDKGGPDLIGGWMLEGKIPLGRPEFVGKFAMGLGGLHDQSDGIRAIPGFGFAYGVDFHLPVTKRTGPTLAFTGLTTFVQGKTYATWSAGLGYTIF